MSNKPFTSIKQQIEILKQRGLTIDNDEDATKFLSRNNYYRVSGYSLTLRSHDQFFPTANFQNIIDIYEFDHELRHILLKYIEQIEVTVKSIYSHKFSEKYGSTGYLNSKYFTDKSKHKVILEKAEEQKKARLKHEAYLKHFVSDLKEDIPLWAYVDLLTISDISILFSISPNELKENIAKEMGIHHKGDTLLGQFMHSITIIRNICAHGGRLFNRLFEQKPNLNSNEKNLLIKKEDNTLDNAHLYGFILIIRRLLLPEEFKNMKKEIIELSKKYPFVRMDYYGFRFDWQEKL